jgi:hypothetical protein
VTAVGAAPTIETIRKDLEAKGISFADTALQGVELDHFQKKSNFWKSSLAVNQHIEFLNHMPAR